MLRRTLRGLLDLMRHGRSRGLEGYDHWEDVGRGQFEYLLARGLRPEHHVLDLPCGSFRAGRFLIEYLERGHYVGMDASEASITRGLNHVLSPDLIRDKEPLVRVQTLGTDRLDIRGIAGRQFDFVWVHALFDHIDHPVIERLLQDLDDCVRPEGSVLATVFLNPHGESFREPMVRPRNGSLERAVVTFPDRELWHHTTEYFDAAARRTRSLTLTECRFDYRHPLGLRMLHFRPGQPRTAAEAAGRGTPGH